MYKLPERRGGGGGGEVIWAMPERKHLFLYEVFPNVTLTGNHFHLQTMSAASAVVTSIKERCKDVALGKIYWKVLLFPQTDFHLGKWVYVG